MKLPVLIFGVAVVYAFSSGRMNVPAYVLILMVLILFIIGVADVLKRRI